MGALPGIEGIIGSSGMYGLASKSHEISAPMGRHNGDISRSVQGSRPSSTNVPGIAAHDLSNSSLSSLGASPCRYRVGVRMGTGGGRGSFSAFSLRISLRAPTLAMTLEVSTGMKITLLFGLAAISFSEST